MHVWTPQSPGVHFCILCGAVEYDSARPTRITDNQATALGFTRSVLTGLLAAKFWTFPEDVFGGPHP